MPGLIGRHQVRNAALAIAIVEALAPDLEIPDAAIALGLKTVDWPARLQRLKDGALTNLLPDGWELWLDGGHNPNAAEVLAHFARGWRDRDLWLVFGALNQRDPIEFLKAFRGKVRGVRGVAIPGEENTLDPQAGADAANLMQMNAAVAPSVRDALEGIARDAGDGGPARVLICGSLYLAGSVLGEA
ncbi:MAG: hypothetical protein HQL36_10805 [Alphaproteobacteria bacterium]|nr:hypothetical protein [Alphaproteobacteria bacterium]